MGHLVMIESWVGAMSTLLPRAIREAGHRFTFVTRDLHHYLRATPGPAGATHPLLTADHVLTLDTNDPDGLAERLAALRGDLGFDGVLSSCDYYLEAVAQVAARLDLPGGPPGAMRAACRKDESRRVLAGLPGPRFVVAEGWEAVRSGAADIGYPLVLKPVDLCAGMFVRRVDDDAALRSAFDDVAGFPVNARGQRRPPQILLEELLDGPEVSVETVTCGGRTHVVGITDKSLAGAPWFVETGHMFPAALGAADAERAAGVAEAAVQALGLDQTVAHTELKLTTDGPKLVEVNPRPAGNRITELVRRVTGIDLARAHAQVALGEAPDLEPAPTGVTSAAVRFWLPDQAAEIVEVRGTEGLAAAAEVVEAVLPEPGRRAGTATSNNHYLGHIMTVSAEPGRARARADELLASVDIRYGADRQPA